MSRPALLDTNMVVYFVTGEPPHLGEAAAQLFMQAERREVELVLPLLTLAEATWVLRTGHDLPRGAVAEVLTPLLAADGVRAEDRDLATEALALFGSRSVDFVDAYLAARARRDGIPVASFDRDFAKLGVERIRPRA